MSLSTRPRKGGGLTFDAECCHTLVDGVEGILCGKLSAMLECASTLFKFVFARLGCRGEGQILTNLHQLAAVLCCQYKR